MNSKGIIRDLLLVSVATLIAVFAVQYIGPKQSGLHSQPGSSDQTVDLAADIDKKTPVTVDSINDQMAALRMEIARAHAALEKKIIDLSYSKQEPQDDSYSVESLMEQFAGQNTLEDQIAVLEVAEEYNLEATEQLRQRIITQLSRLALESSSLNSVDCFASKCTMEFEHGSATDERIFVDHVLFDSKGLFKGEFSYSTVAGEDGNVYTKVLSNR